MERRQLKDQRREPQSPMCACGLEPLQPQRSWARWVDMTRRFN